MSDPTYIATEDIFAAAHVRAFRKGDVVPASVVQSLGCRDKVVTSGAKAAKVAIQEAVAEAALPLGTPVSVLFGDTSPAEKTTSASSSASTSKEE